MIRAAGRTPRTRGNANTRRMARRPSPVEVFPHQVFLFSRIPYREPHHRARQIADQFAEWGVPLTYVEEGGSAGPAGAGGGGMEGGIGQALGRSLKYRLGAAMGFRDPVHAPAAEGRIDIARVPPGIPATRLKALERLNVSLLRQTLERELLPRRVAGLKSVALVNNPLWGQVLRKGDFDRVVYDVTEDPTSFADAAPLARVQECEKVLIGVSDAVIVTTEALEAHVRGLDHLIPISRIPNGVDVEWFQESAAAGSEIDALPEPIVGCVGMAPAGLDVSLIAEVAALLPEVTFLFVGPEVPGSFEAVRRMPNVRSLGPRAYGDIPSIIDACRACWIPLSASAGERIPATLQYFALGKPVVSTPTRELEEYRRRGLVLVGRSSGEIVRALEGALAEENESAVRRRVKAARKHSWEKPIAQLFRVVREGG